jgi:membrane protein YqaA with SNARE-associated domain
MVKQAEDQNTTAIGDETSPPPAKGKKRTGWAITVSIIGIVLTVIMFIAVLYYGDKLAELKQYSYLGAFIISILGGATIIIPVPMLAVVFALGSVMPSPWEVVLLGMSSAVGEVIGALTIYMTGQGAGKAIAVNSQGRLQAGYQRMCDLIERRGPVVLFVLASVINPFFYPAALACGALRFGVKKYTLIVFGGKIIKSMTTVFIGYFGLKNLLRLIGIEI